MPLCPLLTELSCTPLIGQLHKSKGRLEPVHEYHLDILLIDGCVDLVEQFEE